MPARKFAENIEARKFAQSIEAACLAMFCCGPLAFIIRVVRRGGFSSRVFSCRVFLQLRVTAGCRLTVCAGYRSVSAYFALPTGLQHSARCPRPHTSRVRYAQKLKARSVRRRLSSAVPVAAVVFDS